MPSSSNSIGQCSICLSKLSSSNTFVITKCGHTFHENCIIQWLKRSKSCPACRAAASESDVIKLFVQESEETSATKNEIDSENSLFIEKYGFVHRVMKECKCELFSYKNGDLQYRSSMDFNVTVHYRKENGQITVTLQDKYVFTTCPSKRLEILRKETNEKTIITPDGIRYEYFNLPNSENRMIEKILNKYYGIRKLADGTETHVIGFIADTNRGEKDFVKQWDDCIKFYFPNFKVQRRITKENGGHICFVIRSANDRNKWLKIAVCPEHGTFFASHVDENNQIQCLNSKNRCDHIVY